MKLPGWLKSMFSDTVEYKPRPPGWRKTLDDLDAENRSLSGDEIEWARQFEREQLRSWARFPKDGEQFEALRDLSVAYVLHWRSPTSTGGQGVIPAGTRVRVCVPAFDPEPVGVNAIPLNEEQVGRLLVPEQDRSDSQYGGYSLPLKVVQLNKDFRLVTTV